MPKFRKTTLLFLLLLIFSSTLLSTGCGMIKTQEELVMENGIQLLREEKWSEALRIFWILKDEGHDDLDDFYNYFNYAAGMVQRKEYHAAGSSLLEVHFDKDNEFYRVSEAAKASAKRKIDFEEQYSKVKTGLPFIGMRESLIDNSLAEKHDSEETRGNYTYYYWHAFTGEVVLEVVCDGVQVTEVHKENLKWWSGDRISKEANSNQEWVKQEESAKAKKNSGSSSYSSSSNSKKSSSSSKKAKEYEGYDDPEDYADEYEDEYDSWDDAYDDWEVNAD